MFLQKDDHVLFFGDSITDAGRRNDGPTGMGKGYPAMVAASLGFAHAAMNLSFTNRGISGNRIYDLESRLKEDVLDLKPTVVSILIGINDTWRRYDRSIPSPIPEFQASYRRVLQAAAALPARLIICEPFLLPASEKVSPMREDLDPRIASVRELAREFQALYLPLDGLFAAAACIRPMTYWSADGVHPTAAGHAMIADAWIRATVGHV